MANTTCNGNCMGCAIVQRQFCASQLAYNNMKMIESLMQEVSALKESVLDLQKKDNETELINPTTPIDSIAQEEDGAENSSSK